MHSKTLLVISLSFIKKVAHTTQIYHIHKAYAFQTRLADIKLELVCYIIYFG
jgi:hypothetical protein